jgi:hypothetical protein
MCKKRGEEKDACKKHYGDTVLLIFFALKEHGF